MAALRTARRIIKTDVNEDESLLNAPPPGKPHKYAEEMTPTALKHGDLTSAAIATENCCRDDIRRLELKICVCVCVSVCVLF